MLPKNQHGQLRFVNLLQRYLCFLSFFFTDNPIVIINAVRSETNQTPPVKHMFPVTVHTEPDCKKKKKNSLEDRSHVELLEECKSCVQLSLFVFLT